MYILKTFVGLHVRTTAVPPSCAAMPKVHTDPFSLLVCLIVCSSALFVNLFFIKSVFSLFDLVVVVVGMLLEFAHVRHSGLIYLLVICPTL